MQKRILSMILSLSIVASLFAGMTFNVSALTVAATETNGNVTVDHYLSQSDATASHVTEITGTIDSELVNGHLSDDAKAIYNYVRNEDGTVTKTKLDADAVMHNYAQGFNGSDISTSALYNVEYVTEGETKYRIMTKYGRDSQGYYKMYEKRNYCANGSDYMTQDPNGIRERIALEGTTDDDFMVKTALEYRLDAKTTITDVVIALSGTSTRTGYYTILTSIDGNNWEKQFTYMADATIGGKAKINSGIQHLKFDQAVEARFIRMEVYDPLNTAQSTQTPGWTQFMYTGSSLRTRAIQVFGTRGVNAVYENYGTNGTANSSNDAMATKYKEIVGAEGKTSLIKGKNQKTGDAKVHYFISTEGTQGTLIDPTNAATAHMTFDAVTEAVASQLSIDLFTDGVAADCSLVSDIQLKRMFFKNTSDKVDGTHQIDDETKQWLQVSYKLDAEAEIDQILLYGKATNLAWNFSHYKYYLADTEEGLFDEVNCYAEVTAPARISTVSFPEGTKAKYVGIRIINAYGGVNAPSTGQGVNNMYIRTFDFQVFGDYSAQFTDDLTATAEAEGANTTPTATVTVSGNKDTSGKYGKATVALATAGVVNEDGRTYLFDGWYLGEEKVAEVNNFTYNVTGKEANLDFTAKYIIKEYSILGSTDRNDFSDYYDPTKNLILCYVPEVHYYNNTDLLGDTLKATEPTKVTTGSSNKQGTQPVFVDQLGREIDLNTWFTKEEQLTENFPSAFAPADMQIFETKESNLANGLFVTYGEDGHVNGVIDDETKQWAQLSYTLVAPAKINRVSLTNAREMPKGLHWTPSHYKVILSNTVAGLFDESQAVKVVEVKENTNSISAVEFLEPVEARYVAIRIICAYNDTATLHSATYNKSNMYPRFSRIDVTGEYVDTAEGRTVSATAEGATTDATAAFKFYGAPDASGNYAVGNVNLATTGTYTEGTTVYNFLGWYLNDKLVSKDATYTYTVKADDAAELAFVAKYEVPVVTVTFVADGKIIETQTIDYGADATAPAAPAKEGYTFTGWDKAYTAVKENITVTAQYTIKTYTVTFMAEGVFVGEDEVDYGTAATAPAAPAKTGYTFVRWDTDFSNVTKDLTVNAVYEINKYTVTYVFEGEEVGTESVEYGAVANVPAVAGKEGYNVVWNYNDAAIVEDTTITGGYQIKTFTVKFFVEGELVDTQYVDWNTAAKAPEVDAKYGYSFAWDVDFANVTTDLEVNGAYTLTGYVVTFESAAGVVIGEVVVAEGDVPNYDAVKAINEKVENIYGYDKIVNEKGDVVWDQDVYETPINADITVRPFYEAKDVSTFVVLYNLDSKEDYYQAAYQKYDTAIILNVEGAASYVDEAGKVLVDKATGVLYACGATMKIYAVSEQKTAPAVAVVGKVNDGNFSVFAHVNVENATAYGLVFSSKTGFELKSEFTVEDAKADEKGTRYKMVEIDATRVGQVDFMSTLEGTGDKTRYARAYVVVNGQYIYTDAVCNK